MYDNPYLNRSIARTFVGTALPIILFMTVHGLYSVVDAYFLGEYIGPAALSAVTLTFPLQTLIFSFSNLFAKGMASIVARLIGEGKIIRAKQVFVNANFLSLLVFVFFSVFYFLVDDYLLAFIVGDSAELHQLSSDYISVLIIFSPIIGLLILNNDALRSEGKLKFMTLAMVGSALLNIAFDYVFIAKLGWGVSASAYATVLAYGIPLVLVVAYRLNGNSIFTFSFNGLKGIKQDLVSVVSLGLPASLTHLGVAVGVAVVNYSVKAFGGEEFSDTVAAYGVVARLMTFVTFPLIGMAIAFQSILGNNFGAKEIGRSNEVISVGLLVSFLYCLAVEFVFVTLSYFGLGNVFVDDANVARNIEVILRYVFLGFFTVGPVAILASKFYAVGDAKKASLLGPAKSFLVVVPLVLLFPVWLGVEGVWLAIPVSDFVLLLVAFIVMRVSAKRDDVYLGIYFKNLSNA